MNYINAFISNFMDMFLDMSCFIMLGLLLVGILHTFIKKDKILKHLGKDKFSSVVKASVVGVPLPLCSCGVVPTAVELKKSGASNGAVVSFLISTPQTGVDSIFATYSMMGLVMAIFRPIAAFISGILGGAFVNLFAKKEVIAVEGEHTSSCCCHSEETHTCCSHEAPVAELAEEPVAEHSCCCCHSHAEVAVQKTPKWMEVFQYAYGGFLDEIAIHFLVGMFLATIIATFLPADFFVSLGIQQGLVAMLAMVIIGLPMYICSTSSIPIAISLIGKGLSYGGAFVFLFTGPVTNIASLLVLRKVLGKKITGLYLTSVILCSIGFGLLLDVLMSKWDVLSFASAHGAGHFMFPEPVTIVIAIIFALLLVKSIIVRIKGR